MKLFNNGLGRIISFMSLILVLILTFFISLEFLTPTAINVSAHSILTEGSFTSYHGSTSVTYKDAAMVLKSHSNPGTVFFAEREFDDYEMEVEFQLNSGSWFGIMYRAHGAEKGFYQLGPGANGRHQLNRHTTKALGGSWNEEDLIKSTSNYGLYTNGTKAKVYVKVLDNKITIKTQMAENSGYCVEFDNYAIPQALGSSGYVGFCMQVAEMKVYNVKIRDLNSDYSYTSDFEKRSKTESTWGFSVGNATINYADSIYTYTPAKNPSAYIINNVNFKNYEMQVELSFDAQWGGIVYRNNGSNNGFYSIRETSQYLSYYKSGWGDQVQAEAGYSNYAFGSRIRIKVTMNNNHLTIATMLVGVDEDFITTINNLDLSTVYDGALGTSGGVGIVSRSGAIMQIYDFSVVDKDTNLVYHLPQNETASWTNTIGDIGVDQTSDEVTGEEKLELYANLNPSSYMLTGITFENFVLETEFSTIDKWAGIIFRGTQGYNGIYSTNRLLRQYQKGTGYGTSDSSMNALEGYEEYVFGDRIKLRITLKNNLLTVETYIVGKSTEYFKEFTDYDITKIDGGVLSGKGEVGFVVGKNGTMSVYQFKVHDLDTSETYDYFAEEETPISDSVVFDGNMAIDTNKKLTQMPNTTEIWFKTSALERQTLLCDFRYDSYENGFYLDILADGSLYYYETNGTKYAEFNISTGGNYADGMWHKAVIRRYYDDLKDLLKVEITICTNNIIDESVGQTFAIDSGKKALYEANNDTFISERYLQIGTYMQCRYLFKGEIAEIRMWDEPRTNIDILATKASLNGNEEGLIHNFVPNDKGFVDKVTTGSDDEVLAEAYDVWLDDYVLGDADFRIAVLPDVQHIVEKFEVSMRDYFTWIKENAEALNIKMVLSVGDLTNIPNAEQFHIISEAASIIDGVVPFMPVMGNHDYPTTERDATLFNEYFPYEKYAKLDCFGGAYEEGSMENYYYLMNINGVDYMFLALELTVREDVAEWANEVIATHSNHRVILINHAYMDNNFGDLMQKGETGAAGLYKYDGLEATELWDKVISQHDNIIMTFCGHMNSHQIIHREFENKNGHIVQSLEIDFSQGERNFASTNLVGLLGFKDGSNTVSVNAYSMIRDQFYLTINQYEVEIDWPYEYRITFLDNEDNIVSDYSLGAGKLITIPTALSDYSDGIYDYIFEGWDGYSSGLVADKNYQFKAKYSKVETTSITATNNSLLADNIQKAKEQILDGIADSYVLVASNVGQIKEITLDKTFTSESIINVFGNEINVFYIENGNLYIHILALLNASQIKIANTIISYDSLIFKGKTEVILPEDLNRSRYDYLTESYYVSLYGQANIAFTTDVETGENVILLVDGKYQLVTVTEALNQNVALLEVENVDKNYEITVINTNTYSKVKVCVNTLRKTNIDGDLSDWNENILATGKSMVGWWDTAHKNVTYYAYLTDKGLYVAAKANHSIFINTASEWYSNTNLEIVLGGNLISGQYWITANKNYAHASVNGVIKTIQTENGYESIAEGFIAMEDLPKNALSGEIALNMAWKTPNDIIRYSNMVDGFDWWYLTNRHPHNYIDAYYVTSSGIWAYSSQQTIDNIQLDGDFKDFNEEAQKHNLEVYSKDGSVGYSLYAQYIKESGVYVGIKAIHLTNPRPDDNYNWYNNTNLEFYINSKRYYITICGAAYGDGLIAKNIYLAQSYNEENASYETRIELFIPSSSLELNYNDYLKMGFAFKPTGELTAFDGFEKEVDWWYLAGHKPSDLESQFYVYDSGISTTAAIAVNTPTKCTDKYQIQYTSPNGQIYIVEYELESIDNLHMFGETIIVELPTCENYGKGYQQCEYCKAKNNVELLPLGHSYGKVTYTWSEDYSTCKAFRVCEHDSSHVEEEIVTATIKETSATCESKGQVIYEAVFTNYETQIKELETTALGHSYGKVTYTWSEDYSTCKAFRVCEHDSSHIEEEIVTARIEEVKPTTTLDGSKTYTAEFENPNFEIQTHVEILKKQNHQQGCLGSMVSSFGSLIVLATMALFISKKKKY